MAPNYLKVWSREQSHQNRKTKNTHEAYFCKLEPSQLFWIVFVDTFYIILTALLEEQGNVLVSCFCLILFQTPTCDFGCMICFAQSKAADTILALSLFYVVSTAVAKNNQNEWMEWHLFQITRKPMGLVSANQLFLDDFCNEHWWNENWIDRQNNRYGEINHFYRVLF